MEALDAETKVETSPEKKNLKVSAVWIYPVLLAVPFLIAEFLVLSSFAQLPGPIYGGDIYWHYGEALSISLGNPPWSNPQIPGEYAYYGWLTQLFISYVSKITGLGILYAYLYFALIETFLTAIAAFYMGLVFFKNKYAALLVALLSLSIAYQPSIGGLGGYVFLPLFLAFFYKSLEGKIRDKILAGMFFGLASLSHVTYFPVLLVFAVIAFLYLCLFRNWRFRFREGSFSVMPSKPRKADMFPALKSVIPVLAVGIAISLLFWGPVLFVYKASVQNPVDVYANVDLAKFGLQTAYDMITGTYFSLGSLFALDIRNFLFSVAIILGLYLAWQSRSEKREKLFLALFLTSLIVGLHYFVTLPLFGRAAIPPRLYGAITQPLIPLLFTLSLAFLWSFIKNKNMQKIFALIVVVALVFPISQGIANVNNDQWVNVGRNEQFVFSEVELWLKQSTELNDVFLCHQELCFAVNGISGRKVMISRRTHLSPYVNVDQRLADAAVILYGNSTEARKSLLQKYNVKYIYWDVNWLRFAAESEPILVFPDYAEYLQQNGVSFQRVNYYLDPAFSSQHPRYDLLAIGPARDNAEKPWAEGLDAHLELEKEFQIQGQLFARVYKITNLR
ncbi:MAG: hypothetical protein HYW25_02090 [Candidatus Aenigmarchaeota archaeon]|nr:hypothetical protein [Candidatus Aenigmarchaeota archaeon]